TTGTHQARQSVRSTDPDALRSLLHPSRGASTSVRRITGTEIKTLKVTQRKENNIAVAFIRTLSGFFGSLLHGTGALFAGSTKRSTQCDIYGHKRETGSWSEQYPTCIHCNIKITPPDMLRTATARI